MADNHYEVDEGLYHGRKLMDPIRELAARFAQLETTFSVMDTMKDGDGSSPEHFAKVVELYGVKGVDGPAKLAAAKAIYDEINSARSNSAALKQLVARLG